MSLWIKRDVLLPRNRKTYRLAELLAQGGGTLLEPRDEVAWRAVAIVVLEQLWAHVAEHYPAGDITEAPNAELADALSPWLSGTEWARRDVRELLTKSGHLEQTRRGRVVVRDWLEWTGSDAMRLAKDRKRKRMARASRPRTRPRTENGRGAGQPALAEQREAEQREDEKLRDGAAEVWKLLRGNLHDTARAALEGYVRGARNPAMLTLSIAAEGPDGIHAKPGVTYEVLGQALAEMQACGTEFSPRALRAFIRKLLEHPVAPRSDNGRVLTDGEKARAAALKLEQGGAA